MLVSAGAIAYRAVTSVASAAIAKEPATVRPAPESAPLAAQAGPVTSAVSAVGEAARGGDSIPFTEPVPPPAAAATPPRPAPSEAELRAALSATPIVMYSTTWCGVCRKAREFLAENGLQYREIDADTTPGGWAKVEQLTGQRGVPVIIVDGEVTAAGLSPQRVMSAVAHSMERRLGVTGIRFASR